jgi:ABC-type Fe3+ transport system substrate-binding protein
MIKPMRQYAFLILFAVVLVTPFVMRLALKRGEAAAVPRDEHLNRLVVITPHNQDIRKEFSRAFDAWHWKKFGTGVEIDYRNPGGANDIKRQLEITYRAYREKNPDNQDAIGIDVVWGGGDFFFDNELRKADLLQPIDIDRSILESAFPEPALAGVRLYDYAKDAEGHVTKPLWVGVCLSSFGIVYSPDLYRALDLPAPKTWSDMTNEKLAGYVALADPTHSASAAVAYMMVIQRAMADAEEAFIAQHGGTFSKDDPDYQAAIASGWKRGMGQLLLIAANARYFTDSASQVPNDVGSGEAAVGMAIDFYGRVVQGNVGSERCSFVSPVAATAITPDPVGILPGVEGERLLLANRFVEFLLTPEAQRLWIVQPGEPDGPQRRSLRRPPIRRDVYDDRTGWADDVNPFQDAGGFNQRGSWMALFTDTRPIWAAAWIDARESLKQAYSMILKVPDAKRRSELIVELADLPIEMKDVAALRAERLEVEKFGDSDEWKARQRIEWARRFREHYARSADGSEATAP